VGGAGGTADWEKLTVRPAIVAVADRVALPV
jgi:hypothetical protein